ncbi:dihydroorotate dehydrogenase [Niveomyces insectorum RCEF 264]|uniref:Dihydroorotate dehydrogenase (fumarate) n=1 Tax=Niveomyces insectorum RCEF 264 TaxID=1081102 RepID=A0A167VF80_9HYPO|nr:dihydroorotate dehydrogenase [Niveomyces insectorum RCEF 264]
MLARPPPPPMLVIDPPLLNTANPWATDLADLTALYDCPHTGAVTTRTALLAGFPHDPDRHQFAFFDPATHKLAKATTATNNASLNTLGYSPLPLDQYLAFIRAIASRPGSSSSSSATTATKKGFIVSVTGSPADVAACYKRIAAAQADLPAPDRVPLAMEVNLSCPNIPGAPPPAYDGPALGAYLAALQAAMAETATSTTTATRIPVGFKTPPYTHAGEFDVLLGALRASAAVADATATSGVCPLSFLTATNTLGSCLVLADNNNNNAPALPDPGIGGMAGAPLHPLALGNVATLRRRLDAEPAALGHIRLTAAVGVGTALGVHGVAVFGQILENAYLIATAACAPLAGRLATVFPTRALVAGAAFCFAAGTVLTAYAQSLATFLAGRVVVGVGGAGVLTLAFVVVLQLAPRHRRGLWVGAVNAGFTVGLSTGAVVYGALLPVLGWRTLFLLQAPVALLAGTSTLLSMPALGPGLDGTTAKPDTRTVWQKLARIDYAGAILLKTLTIVLFLYALSGTVRPRMLAASATGLALFLAVEAGYVPWLLATGRGGEHDGDADDHRTLPLVPLRVLRSRGVLFTCLAQLGVMAARWTVLYYAPVYVLAVRGQSAAVAGAVLLPTNAGFGTGGLVVGWLHSGRRRRTLVTRLVGSPALVFGRDDNDATGQPVLTAAERAVAVASYATSLRALYHGAALLSLAVLVLQAGTGWTEPPLVKTVRETAAYHGVVGRGDDDHDDDNDDHDDEADDEEEEEEEDDAEEEIREAMAEHDTRMEA